MNNSRAADRLGGFIIGQVIFDRLASSCGTLQKIAQ